DQVNEFLHPPAAAQLGERGQLVVFVGDALVRLDVKQAMGGPLQPIGSSGWKARLVAFDDNGREHQNMSSFAPAVTFEIQSPAGKSRTWQCHARFGGLCLSPDQKQQMASVPELTDVKAWYHYADQRWGNTNTRGVLQFLTGESGKLFFRSYSSA